MPLVHFRQNFKNEINTAGSPFSWDLLKSHSIWLFAFGTLFYYAAYSVLVLLVPFVNNVMDTTSNRQSHVVDAYDNPFRCDQFAGGLFADIGGDCIQAVVRLWFDKNKKFE